MDNEFKGGFIAIAVGIFLLVIGGIGDYLMAMVIGIVFFVFGIIAVIYIYKSDSNSVDENEQKVSIKNNNRTQTYNRKTTYVNANAPRVGLLEWVDITFPYEKDVWKIKIIPVEYESKLVYKEGQGFANKVEYESVRRSRLPEDNMDNVISQDTPLAQAILGKKEGDTYSYIDRNNHWITGKIIKIYVEEKE